MTRLRASGTKTDPYSQTEVLDWSVPPAEAPIVTLAPPEPRPSSEPVQEARNSVTSGWTLYLPYGTDVTEHDRIRIRGEVYAVKGEPADWLSAGIVVQTEHTKG